MEFGNGMCGAVNGNDVVVSGSGGSCNTAGAAATRGKKVGRVPSVGETWAKGVYLGLGRYPVGATTTQMMVLVKTAGVTVDGTGE